jgi:hypothetical protein
MTSSCPDRPRPINTLTILQFQASVHDNVSISDHLYSLMSIVSYAGKHPYMIPCPFKFLIGRALCHVWVYHRIHRNPQIASSSHSSTLRYPGWLGVLAVWEKLQQSNGLMSARPLTTAFRIEANWHTPCTRFPTLLGRWGELLPNAISVNNSSDIPGRRGELLH